MFASHSLTIHLMRGGVGLGALAAAIAWGQAQPWLLVLALPIALIALRGCPMCWTVGLIETLIAKLQGRANEGACIDGSCALSREKARSA